MFEFIDVFLLSFGYIRLKLGKGELRILIVRRGQERDPVASVHGAVLPPIAPFIGAEQGRENK